jgi:hypothetical protein
LIQLPKKIAILCVRPATVENSIPWGKWGYFKTTASRMYLSSGFVRGNPAENRPKAAPAPPPPGEGRLTQPSQPVFVAKRNENGLAALATQPRKPLKLESQRRAAWENPQTLGRRRRVKVFAEIGELYAEPDSK